MAKKKKVNPCRKPATMADVKQAREKAKNDAISLAMALFLTVLCDKFGYDAEKLKAVWDEVNYLSDSVAKGYVNIFDLVEVLDTEYGIQITLS